MYDEVSEYKLREWSKIIAAANASEMKRVDWLKANNITRDTYYYWRKRVQKWILEKQPSNSMPVVRTGEDAALVELPIGSKDVHTVADIAAVMYFGSIRIEMSNNASTEFMNNLGRMIHNAL